MNKKQIVLTEQDLHFLVENAVKTYLVENDMEEGIWGGLKNSARSLFNGNYSNLLQAYSQGSWASSINKYYQTAQSGLKGMQQIMNNSRDFKASNVIQQIIQNLSDVVQNYQRIATNTSNKSSMRLTPQQMQQQMMSQGNQQQMVSQGNQQRMTKQPRFDKDNMYNSYNTLNNGLGAQNQGATSKERGNKKQV